MPLYAPHCDVMRECRTISQLAQVADNLVHHWWRRGRSVADLYSGLCQDGA